MVLLLVHALPTKQATTFDEYGEKIFLPWTHQQLQNSDRIDIGMLLRVSKSVLERREEEEQEGKSGDKLSYLQFLHDPMNKTELFEFLTKVVANCNYPAGKSLQVYF